MLITNTELGTLVTLWLLRFTTQRSSPGSRTQLITRALVFVFHAPKSTKSNFEKKTGTTFKPTVQIIFTSLFLHIIS
ncbi:hypothetical protein CPB84DRAFT_177997 [Gymnopilus junonius]|uniref:Secreted protein n=1 Tax=Gymnopilus junonius TaxID=109634 RepID=A0A9P5TI88_GYMJU|nr:hypothetical protein CPB84DRAFT_177997 [Gymnopilus junonius]